MAESAPRTPRRALRRRVLLLAGALLLALVGAAALLYYAIQTAPVRVNTVRAADDEPGATAAEATADATAEATAADLRIDGGSGMLGFISNRDGNWEVYVMTGDGSDPLNVSNHPADEWFPNWSLDGSRLTMISSRTGDTAPVLVRPDGSDPQELTVFGAITTLFGAGLLDWDPVYPPSSSAASSAFAWVSLRDLNLEVYLMPDTASPQVFNRYTAGFAYDWFPAWSPDGSRIAFSSERDGNLEVYVMPTAFSAVNADQTRLTDNPADDLYAVWSLDGTQLLFVSERERSLLDGYFDLYVMNADGTDQRPLGDAVFEGDPSWSPDGRQMVYMSNRDGDWDLYLVDLSSGAERNLTNNDADDLFPIWRPAAEASSLP